MRSKVSLLVLMTIACIALATHRGPPARAGSSDFFEDNFDGTTLDSSHWTASTNGGLVSVDNGSLHMSSSSLDFPYVASGGTVFPPSGNFQVEIAAQYSQHPGQGDGIVVLGPGHQPLFILWGSGLVVALEGTSQVAVAGPLDPHNYRLTFVDGVATIFVDNVQVLTTPLSVRPESLWLGTPTIGQVSMWPLWSGWVGIVDGHVDPTTAVVQSRWWYGTNWSPFSVDYIRVSGLVPPPPAFRLPWDESTESWYYYCAPHTFCTNGYPTGVHEGLDFGSSPTYQVCTSQSDQSSAVVRSVGTGHVLVVASAANGGHYEIDLGGGLVAKYEHVAVEPPRSVTDLVHAGYPLGHPSCLGTASAVHTHLGFYRNGNPLDWYSSGITLSGWGVAADGSLTHAGCPVIQPRSSDPLHPEDDTRVACPRIPPTWQDLYFLAQGDTHDSTFTVPAGQGMQGVGVYWMGSTVDSWLIAPDSTVVDASSTDANVSHVKGDTFEYYTVRNPQAGTWTLHSYGADLPNGQEAVTAGAGYCPQAAHDAAGDPCSGDDDGDGCPDDTEATTTTGSQGSGGLRDPLNPWDYFNPTHDGKIRVDDILMVVHQFFKDSGSPAYNPDTDRTLVGPNAWNLGPPDGQQRVDDILHSVHQFFHDCS